MLSPSGINTDTFFAMFNFAVLRAAKLAPEILQPLRLRIVRVLENLTMLKTEAQMVSSRADSERLNELKDGD